jgi:mannose-6-phosphate isomerase-like protein (cupin superfamily)
MNDYDKYSIDPEVKFKPLEIVNIPQIIAKSDKKWQNLFLCLLNDSIVRLAVVEGEFHWHKHKKEDEFFFVIEGVLLIDLELKTVELKQHQGFTVSRGVKHRTRASTRTSVLVIEQTTTQPTGG